MRALALVGLLLIAGLSGCAGPDMTGTDDGLSGGIEQRVVDRGTGEGSGAGAAEPGAVTPSSDEVGSIDGVVVDDLNMTLASAAVSVLDTDLFVAADNRGRFAFADLEPGRYVLRVLLEPYRPHEGGIDVVAGKVTQITVTLVPKEDVGAGYRPHIHDFWQGRSEVEIMDASIDWATTGTYSGYPVAGEILQGIYQPNNSNWWVTYTIPARDDNLPPTIWPGTAKIKVVMTWGSDVDVDKMKLQYVDAAGTAWVVKDIRDVPPMAKGEEITFDITGDVTDNGHQGFSLWDFRIQPTARTVPNTIQGPIQVKMTLVQGEVAVEKPHEDFWNGSSQLVLRNFTTAQTYNTLTIGIYGSNILIPLDTGRIVPPGTQELRIRMDWAYRPANAQTVPPSADWTYALHWKTANLPPDHPVSGFATLAPTDTGEAYREYVIPVEKSQTDAFYQQKTNWLFHPQAATPAGTDDRNFDSYHVWHLEVIAVKDPNFV